MQQTQPPQFEHANQKFQLKLTLGQIDRILEETGVDLAPDDSDYDPFIDLKGMPRKLSSFLWAVFKTQCEANNVEESVFRDMDGETLAAGWQCVFQAIDFFIQLQSQSRSEALRQYLESRTELEMKFATETKDRLEEMRQEKQSDSDAESVPPSSDSSPGDTATES